MVDAETGRQGGIHVGLSWQRPGRTLRPAVVLATGAEVAVAVTVGGRTLLAVAGLDGPPAVVSLWDTATGEKAGEPLEYPAEAVLAMVTLPAPDGTAVLAVAYHDDGRSLVRVWDPATGDLIGKPLPGPFDDTGLAAVPLPDGRHLLAVLEESDGTLRLWDPATGEPVLGPLRTGPGPEKPDVWAVAAVTGPDGSPLVLTLHGDENQAVVRSWDPVGGEPLRLLLRTRHDEGDPARLAALPLSDGRLVVALSRGHEDDGFVVRLWDAATGEVIGGPIEGDGLLPLPGDAAPLLAVGDGLWDPGSGRRVGDGGTNGVPRPLAAVPALDGSTLLAGTGPDGMLWLWDPAETRPLPAAERMGPVGLLTPVTLPDGRTWFAAAAPTGVGRLVDGTVRFWDAFTGEPAAQPLTGHAGGLTAMASAPLPDGGVALVTCDGNGTIRSWDPVTGRLLATVPTARDNVIRSMTAIGMPDGRTALATGNDMNVLRLRDPATGGSVSAMFTRLDRQPLTALATVYLPDGRMSLAAGSATPARGGSRATRLWDPVTGLPVGEPFGTEVRVRSLAATPRGHDRVLLAVGTDDDMIRIHDLDSRAVLGELPGRHPCLLAVPGGGPVLALTRQDEVQLWDPVTCRRLASRRMGTQVLTLAAAGSHLAAGCGEGLAVLHLGELSA